MSWKAVYIKSKCEKKTQDMLGAAGINAFLPLQASIKQTLNRKIKVEKPMLKGYLFVKDLEEKQKEIILKNPYTIGFLKYLGKEAEIKDTEIEILKEIAEKGYFVETLAHKINKGSLVELSSGPFKNQKAKVLRVKKNMATLLLLLESMKQCLKVKVPVGMLKVNKGV